MHFPRFSRNRLGALGCGAACALVIAACGTASGGELAGSLKKYLTDPKNAATLKEHGLASTNSVSCPSGVKLQDGATFNCTVSGTDTKGQAATFAVAGKIVNGNQPSIDSIQEEGGAATPSTPATTTT
jgi:hypothetical protein